MSAVAWRACYQAAALSRGYPKELACAKRRSKCLPELGCSFPAINTDGESPPWALVRDRSASADEMPSSLKVWSACLSPKCIKCQVKKLNAWMSRAAYDLALSRASFSAWHKETTNEHEDELSQVWQWIVDHRETITAEELEARLRSRPYVTVTLAEDMALRKLKGIPLEQRYRRADVLVGKAADLWKGDRPCRESTRMVAPRSILSYVS